jgi:hypothetical protein
MARPLYEIAHDVRAHWPNVNYAATPYLAAMFQLDKITDYFYEDSADSIVRYFLSNATTWRGEDARRVKAELKEMIK